MNDGFGCVGSKDLIESSSVENVTLYEGAPLHRPRVAVSQIVEHNWLISRPPERFAHVGADISCATCHEHCRLNHLAQCYNPNLTGATNEPRGDTQRRSFSESSISLTQDL